MRSPLAAPLLSGRGAVALTLLLVLSASLAAAQQPIAVVAFNDFTCGAGVITAPPLLFASGVCSQFGAGAQGYAVFTHNLDSTISYRYACTVGCGTCQLQGLMTPHLCIVVPATQAGTASTSMTAYQISASMTFTTGVALTRDCQVSALNGITQTLCPGILDWPTRSSGVCQWADGARPNLGRILLMPSSLAPGLMYASAGCSDSECKSCVLFAKCTLAENQYSCVSAGGSLLTKDVYAFPDLTDTSAGVRAIASMAAVATAAVATALAVIAAF